MRQSRTPFLALILAIAAAAPAQQGSSPAAAAADYVVLTAVAEGGPFDAAARHLVDHHRAALVRFDPADLDPVRAALTAAAPRHVALVMRPEQLDFAFARRFLQLATEIDDDPFVDFAFGYITGATAAEAVALARRGTARKPLQAKPRHASVAGGAERSFVTERPQLLGRVRLDAVQFYCAGEEAFPDTGRDRAFLAENLPKLEGRDTVTFIGHGWPREVHGGPDHGDLAGLDLDGAVALNVACYTGVTNGYFEDDYRRGLIRRKEVPFEESFCLALLRTGVVGYTAYLCPRPAGPELDTDLAALVADGVSLGEARRRDYDKTVLGFLGFGEDRLLCGPIADGGRISRSGDVVRDIMLEGATGGVLFGDPACIPFAGLRGAAPVAITIENNGSGLRLRARAAVTALYLQCSDPTAKWGETMAMKVHARVPIGERLIEDVTVDELKIGRDVQPSRVLWAIEDDHGERFLQLKVNFPRGERMLGELKLAVRIAATTDPDKAKRRGGEVQRPRHDAAMASSPRDPFALAADREIAREAVQAALDASAALLSGSGGDALQKLGEFGSEGFRAACVLLESGTSHHRSFEMLKATWHPGDERHLIALASGPALPNFASWTVLRGLGVADTPAVRALLLQRLATETDAGLFMSAAQGLAMLGAKEAAAAIGDRVLEFRSAWSGVESYLIAALAE
ncbi:MAG: hypothetical protein KDC98_00735, partial [Planctomycetes bacterium]|nr:hypothetical protein [Planctomycetota bacterium]